MQHRRLTAHLQTQKADSTQRVQTYLVNHVAVRQAVGQSAVDGMRMSNQQFHPNAQYSIPGFTQLPQQQPVYPGSIMPSQSISLRSKRCKRPAMQASQFDTGFDQHMKAGMHPFTVTLPMESQQLLAESSLLDPSMPMMFSQYKYSYNPNGKPRSRTQPSMNGRNRKLMGPPLDTTFRGCDSRSFMASQQVTSTDLSYIPLTRKYGYRMSFDSGSAETMYKTRFDGTGNIALQDLEFSSMFEFQDLMTEEEQWLA
ncbi:hypothetical protein LTR56_023044 [Elasticomyces elasticus]|nr:hypothetical protein LTR56_023044 [Elasticomyces elasticus]KAK4904625.1 hypothetical protein LTR49_025960 [Elasticomyces elasticus]KAK5744825.1 hypothetical protein LTS12_023353 [Elasticomyces elasticus]